MPYLAIAYSLVALRAVVRPMGDLSRTAYLIVVWFLFIFTAFRFQVGCDWGGYFNQYLVAGYQTWSDLLAGRDFLWWVVMKGIAERGIPYPWINVISAAVFFLGVHALGRRQPDPLAFIVVLFPILIVNMPMSGIRQGAAIGLFCLALCAFMDRKPILYAVWILIASSIHSSAMIFFILLPFSTGVYNRNRYIVAVIVTIPGIILLSSGSSAELALDRYVNSGNEAFGAVFRLMFLALSGAAFFVFLRKPWRRLAPGDYPLASLGALMMIALITLIPLSTVISDRLGYYLLPIQAVIFARVPFLFTGFNRNVLAVVPYVGLLVLFTVWTLTSRHFAQCYLPYQSWLTGISGLGN